MHTWAGVRLGLMALGYRRVIWLHLHCPTDGLFRCGVPEELDEYACPTCGQPSKASILAEGFTKAELPLPPQQIVRPLSVTTRKHLMVEERIPKRRPVPDPRHGLKIRNVKRVMGSP